MASSSVFALFAGQFYELLHIKKKKFFSPFLSDFIKRKTKNRHRNFIMPIIVAAVAAT